MFAVNGKRFELAKVDPSTSLLEFLRTRTRFTGPKLGCGEGKDFLTFVVVVVFWISGSDILVCFLKVHLFRWLVILIRKDANFLIGLWTFLLVLLSFVNSSESSFIFFYERR